MEEFAGEETVLMEQTKAKLMDFTKDELVRLIVRLENEVRTRDAVINELINKQTKQTLYSAKYGKFSFGDPFVALQRDSEKVADDSFDHNQVKTVFDNQLQQLENLIDTQKKAQAKIREQKLAADERYKNVCLELEETKRRHALDTAQGDDVTVALEKEREKLQHDLAYARNQTKKSEKELKKMKQELDKQVSLSTKYKQVALDLIKERRRMVSKVVESEKRNQSIAQILQKEHEDNKKAENSKLLQLEARMEKQLMDFDIEREQYKARIRKEESKVKDLLQQLNDIKDTVLSLQQDATPQVAASTVVKVEVGDKKPDSPSHTTSAKPIDLSTAKPSLVSNIPGSHMNTILHQPLTAKLSQGPTLSPPSTISTTVSQNFNGMPQVRVTQNLQPDILEPPKPYASSSDTPSVKVQMTRKSLSSATDNHKQTTEMTTSNSLNASSLSSMKPVIQADPQLDTTSTEVIPIVTSPSVSTLSTNTGRYVPRASAQVSNSPIKARTASTTKIVTPSGTSNKTMSNKTTSNFTSKSIAPPHLGSTNIMDNKNTHLTRSSDLAGPNENSPMNSSRLRYTVSVDSSSTKNPPTRPKPPPPVRNVSLHGSKKYQSLDGSKVIGGSAASTH